MTDRAQSESIGIILLTAVVVITVGTAGAVVLSGAGVTSDERITADVSIEMTTGGVGLVHGGGESIPFGEMRVVVRSGNETWQPAVNATGLENGNGDARFDPGERWTGTHSLDAGTITTVQVFHVESGTLLAEARRYPSQEATLTPTPSAASEDSSDPSIQLLSPESGDAVMGGTDLRVEWTASDANTTVETVDVQYSPDGGDSWQTLVTNTADDGRQVVQVPADSTTDARIRVRAVDTAGKTAFDRSPTFTVDSDQPSIDSVSPNAGAPTVVEREGNDWRDVTVSWDVSDATTSVRSVLVSVENASTTVVETTRTVANGSTTLTMPEGTVPGNYSIGIRAVDVVGNDRIDERSDAIVVEGTEEDVSREFDSVSVTDLMSGRAGQDQTVSFTLNGTLAKGETVKIDLSDAQAPDAIDYRDASVDSSNAEFTTTGADTAVITFTAESAVGSGETVSITITGVETAEDYSAQHSVAFERSDGSGSTTASFVVRLSGGEKIDDRDGDVYVDGDATLSQKATIDGNLSATGTVTLKQKSTVTGNIDADGVVTLKQKTTVTGDIDSSGDVTLKQKTTVEGDVRSDGVVTLKQKSEVTGDVFVDNTDDIKCKNQTTIDGQSCEEYVEENY